MKLQMQPDGELCGFRCAAEEVGRWRMDHTLLVVVDGCAQLVTTNGKTLAVCQAEAGPHDPKDFAGLLPPGFVSLARAEWHAARAAAMSFVHDEECDFCGQSAPSTLVEVHVAIKENGAGGHVLEGKITGLRLPIEPLGEGAMGYPKWQTVVPKASVENHAVAYVDADLLRDALQAVATQYVALWIPLAKPGAPVLLCAQHNPGDQAQAFAVLMPVQLDEQPITEPKVTVLPHPSPAASPATQGGGA